MRGRLSTVASAPDRAGSSFSTQNHGRRAPDSGRPSGINPASRILRLPQALKIASETDTAAKMHDTEERLLGELRELTRPFCDALSSAGFDVREGGDDRR